MNEEPKPIVPSPPLRRPRPITIDVEIYEKDVPRLVEQSQVTGMHRDELVSKLLETTLDFPELQRSKSKPESPSSEFGESLAQPAFPVIAEVLRVGITPKLNRKLVELSRLSGLAKTRIAGLLLEDRRLPTRAAIEAMVRLGNHVRQLNTP